MIKIYSKKQPDLLLHIVFRNEDFDDVERENLIDNDQFLQCAALNMNKGKTFRPHKHIFKQIKIPSIIAQESWVVLSGRVRCTFYDIDDSVIATPVLGAGDASFTLRGGHTYLILDDNSKVLEYKTGPYYGQQSDKTFLDG